ncbi:MAG: TRAP transporter small permease subunit [Rhodobacteraceae bacterium]|nr:TRAP transporter small permease subunit [Paracoccaceae bacterium]
MTFYERTERGMTRLAAGLALLGGLGLIFATLVTCVSILLKLGGRIFDNTTESLSWLRPILGEEELVTYGVGFALFAALPWVMIQRGHIKIDLFEPVFGDRFNRVLDLIGDVILAALAYLILTRQWYMLFSKARGSKEPLGNLLLQGDFAAAADRMRTSQESQILGLPLWPTYIVAEICVAVFFVVAVFCVWRRVRALFSPYTTEV